MQDGFIKQILAAQKRQVLCVREWQEFNPRRSSQSVTGYTQKKAKKHAKKYAKYAKNTQSSCTTRSKVLSKMLR